MGVLTLVAIVSVVVLVSLPRLRGFAQLQNEQDAIAATRRIAALVADLAEEASLHAPGRIPTIAEVVERNELGPELVDLELLDGGRLMRRHGYLFRIEAGLSAPGPAAESYGGRTVLAGEPQPVAGVVAWPWRASSTGRAVFLGLGADVFGHRNETCAWSGPQAPPEGPWSGAPWAAGWLHLR